MSIQSSPRPDRRPRDAGAEQRWRAISRRRSQAGRLQLVDHGVTLVRSRAHSRPPATFFPTAVEERLKVRIDRHNRRYAPLHRPSIPGNLPDLRKASISAPVSRRRYDFKAESDAWGNQWRRSRAFRTAVEKHFAASWRGRRLTRPSSRCVSGLRRGHCGRSYSKP